MKLLTLFIDESGQSNPKALKAGVYIVSGCMVDAQSRDNLKIKADQVKFKYWERTDIVFHSREIGRQERDFAILKDRSVKNSFEKNLFQFLMQENFQMLFTLIDQVQAKKQNWNEDKIYQETSRLMVRNFLLRLLAGDNCRGRIVIESATAKKDFYFHRAAGYYLSAGLPEVNVSYQKIQQLLTEISFVTKNNHDIEEQIADLLAYGAKLKFAKKKTLSAYAKKLLKLTNSKIYRMEPNIGVKKKKFCSLIEAFKILP